MGHYIPLTWLTLALNYMVGGMNPWGYHAVNVALHAANAVLVYLIRPAAARGGPGSRGLGDAAGDLGGRGALRAASAPGGVGRVDHGASRRPERPVLPARGPGLPARGGERRPREALARPLAGLLRGGTPLEGLGDDSARGPAAPGLVSARPMAAGRAARAAGEGRLRGPRAGRRGGGRHRPPRGDSRHVLREPRARGARGHGRLQRFHLPGAIPVAGPSVAPLPDPGRRAPGAGAVPGPRGDRDPRLGRAHCTAAALAGRSRGVGLLGGGGRPGERHRPRRVSARARPLTAIFRGSASRCWPAAAWRGSRGRARAVACVA